MMKILEGVRQVRHEAHPQVQVEADLALVHGTGGSLGTRMASSTQFWEQRTHDCH